MQQITNGNIARQLQLGTVRLTETWHRPGLRLAPHDHDNANINIVIDGGLDESVEHASFACPKFSLLLKPAGAQHSNIYGKKYTRCLIVEFLPAFLHSIEGEAWLHEIEFARGPALRVMVRQLSYEFSMRDSASSLIIEGIALQLLGMLCRRRSKREPTLPGWLKTARELLENRDGCPRSISELATLVQVDRSHLSREFVRRFGVSPGQYVRELRVQEAAELLRTTTRTPLQIACDTGFSDQSHFTRVFAKHVGLTPINYRHAFSSQKCKNLTSVQD
jgi:AraC family transcriptional regulator